MTERKHKGLQYRHTLGGFKKASAADVYRDRIRRNQQGTVGESIPSK